jgi:hypothetical protein
MLLYLPFSSPSSFLTEIFDALLLPSRMSSSKFAPDKNVEVLALQDKLAWKESQVKQLVERSRSRRHCLQTRVCRRSDTQPTFVR